MAKLDVKYLNLDRCPHCNIHRPSLEAKATFETKSFNGVIARKWGVYVCRTCGGVVTASGEWGFTAMEVFPQPSTVSEELPDRAGDYLQQAIESKHAPAGAIMLAASAVDWMLKEKGYREGSLYKRIEKAAADNLITQEMAAWAHEIRLDANDQRHADVAAPMPTKDDAERTLQFAASLGEFLFVLPAKVARGRRVPEGTGGT